MAYPQLRASITSTATDTDANNIVCTHPTGLTAGDFMVLYVAFYSTSSGNTVTTPSGWTSQNSSTISSDRRGFYCFKKIASSGDVSAGSTTVSLNATVDKLGYAMFAMTGAAPGSEITLSETDLITSGGTTLTATTAITPLTSESLVFSAFYVADSDLSATLTASSFSLTPTTTITERVDVGIRDGASDGFSLFIATAEYAGLTEITSRSVTVSESVGTDTASIFFLVNAPQDGTGTNDLLSVSPTLFAQNGTSGTTGTNTLLENTNTFFDQSGIGETPTNWTNESKPTTDWTNEQK